MSPGPSRADIIPRGGTCRSCGTYTLWGDVIRGCFRRREGGATLEAEPEDQEDDTGELFDDNVQHNDTGQPSALAPPRTKKTKSVKPGPKGRAARATKSARQLSTLAPRASSDEGEYFDLNAISSCDEEQSSGDERPPWLPTKASSKPHSSPAVLGEWDMVLGNFWGIRTDPCTRSSVTAHKSSHPHKPASHSIEAHGRPRARGPATSGGTRFALTSAGHLSFS